jgi:hypothetical protein
MLCIRTGYRFMLNYERPCIGCGGLCEVSKCSDMKWTNSKQKNAHYDKIVVGKEESNGTPVLKPYLPQQEEASD